MLHREECDRQRLEEDKRMRQLGEAAETDAAARLNISLMALLSQTRRVLAHQGAGRKRSRDEL